MTAPAPTPLQPRPWPAGSLPAAYCLALGAVLALEPLALVTPAQAQVSVGAALTSDYQYRGISLSDGKPALGVNIAYDHASGGYVGGSAVAEDTATSGIQWLGHVEYIGYSHRIRSNLTWDLGVTNQNIRKYYDQRYVLNYTQAYAGLITEHFSYYVYYSPDYFGEGLHTVYLDLSGGLRPGRRWRVFGHIGALAAFGGHGPFPGAYQRYDFRAGVAAEFKHGELQLMWTTVSPDTVYLAGQPQSRPALVVTATGFF